MSEIDSNNVTREQMLVVLFVTAYTVIRNIAKTLAHGRNQTTPVVKALEQLSSELGMTLTCLVDAFEEIFEHDEDLTRVANKLNDNQADSLAVVICMSVVLTNTIVRLFSKLGLNGYDLVTNDEREHFVRWLIITDVINRNYYCNPAALSKVVPFVFQELIADATSKLVAKAHEVKMQRGEGAAT